MKTFTASTFFLLFALTVAPAADKGKPGVEVHSKSEKGKAIVEDVSYRDASGSSRAAYYVHPQRGPVRAAILFVHWLGEPPKNDRTEFLDDAVELAGDGVASLLPQEPWGSGKWFEERKLPDDPAFSKTEVQSLKLAFNALMSQAGRLPAKRVALVAHDFGAMYGSRLLAEEPRIGKTVLMAGVPVFADWFLLGQKLSDADTKSYRQTMRDWEVPKYMKQRKAPLTSLFQFAKKDFYVSEAQAKGFFDAFPQPKEIKWYDDKHRLGKPEVAADRLKWLREHLR